MQNKSEKKCWYVIQTKPKREDSVSVLLNKGRLETFLPKIRFFSSFFKGKASAHAKPLFPSYLFVRFSKNDFHSYNMTQFTPGVRKILKDERGPIPIDDELIDLIKKSSGSERLIEEQYRLKKGSKVRVKRGILSELIGILEKPVDEFGRVRVLFKMLQGKMKATMFCGDLELAL